MYLLSNGIETSLQLEWKFSWLDELTSVILWLLRCSCVARLNEPNHRTINPELATFFQRISLLFSWLVHASSYSTCSIIVKILIGESKAKHRSFHNKNEAQSGWLVATDKVLSDKCFSISTINCISKCIYTRAFALRFFQAIATFPLYAAGNITLSISLISLAVSISFPSLRLRLESERSINRHLTFILISRAPSNIQFPPEIFLSSFAPDYPFQSPLLITSWSQSIVDYAATCAANYIESRNPATIATESLQVSWLRCFWIQPR